MDKFIYALFNIDFNDFTLIKDEILYIESKKGHNFQVISMVQGKTFEISYDSVYSKDANIKLYNVFDPNSTGDNFETKVCNVCHRLLPTELFDINQTGKDNRIVRRPSCKLCREIIDGVPLKSEEKKIWSKKKPHMIPFECPVCKKRTIPGLTSKVVLDHNHDTGVGRAYICDSCNTGLGRFKDNIELLKNAMKYLEKE